MTFQKITMDPATRARNWLQHWKQGTTHSILVLYGPSGSGKSHTAATVARECGYCNIIETNASDYRTRKQLIEHRDYAYVRLRSTALLASPILFDAPLKRRRDLKSLLLFEEVDDMSVDGLAYVVELGARAHVPVVCTCDDAATVLQRCPALRQCGFRVEFGRVPEDEVVRILLERGRFTEDQLAQARVVATQCGGNLHAALNQSGAMDSLTQETDPYLVVPGYLQTHYPSRCTDIDTCARVATYNSEADQYQYKVPERIYAIFAVDSPLSSLNKSSRYAQKGGHVPPRGPLTLSAPPGVDKEGFLGWGVSTFCKWWLSEISGGRDLETNVQRLQDFMAAYGVSGRDVLSVVGGSASADQLAVWRVALGVDV